MFSTILCNPQMGENIGAAARAMYNFGLTDLRLVNPRDGWPNEAAFAVSAGALEAMPPVKVFDTLPQAIEDLHFVLGTTARQRAMVKPVYTPCTAVEEMHRREHISQKAGILFGAERSGLLNDELAICAGFITIPTQEHFSSLNLGQSVLLMAYEYSKTQLPIEKSSNTPNLDNIPAQQHDREIFMQRLESELEIAGFFRTEELKPTIKRNIRNIFSRSDITQQELKTLHGIITALTLHKK